MVGTSSQLQARRRPSMAPGRGTYLVESLFLLTILAMAVAVFMSIFSLAVRRGDESSALERATQLATVTAERFCADPAAAEAERTEDGLLVTCAVTPEETPAGTLYRATVTVRDEAGRELYALDTARYVSGVS